MTPTKVWLAAVGSAGHRWIGVTAWSAHRSERTTYEEMT